MSKPKLILHIGSEKTGTTSIQKFLKVNRAELQKSGVYVPKTLEDRGGNQRWLPFLFQNNPNDEFAAKLKLRGSQKADERRQCVRTRKKQFTKEVEAYTKFPTFIISSEHLQSRLKSEEEIKNLSDFLYSLFSEITIVYYLRDPLQTAISLFSTNLISGNVADTLSPPDNDYIEHVCNHSKALSIWRNSFSCANFVVKLFDRSLLAEGDIVKDFIFSLEPIKTIKNFTMPNRENETLSLSGMRLLRRFNIEVPAYVNGSQNIYRGDIVNFIRNQTKKSEKFLPTLAEYTQYKEYYAESNEEVRKNYFPLMEQLYLPPPIFSPSKINLKDTDPNATELYFDLLKALWIRNRKQLSLKLK